MLTSKKLNQRIDAAQGIIKSDFVINDIEFFDVFNCCWKKGQVAIFDGVIVGINGNLKGQREINGKHKFLVPGFIDAHVHVESSFLSLSEFQKLILQKGTTTVICDPHELVNVIGSNGIEYFLNEKLELDLKVMLSSCVPTLDIETNGGGSIDTNILSKYLPHPRVLGLGEMMDYRGVLNKKESVISKLIEFQEKPIDGHCPLIRGNSLSAYACGKISSCHESTVLEEAEEKISKGFSIWIREGSAAKNLSSLWPLLENASIINVGFCTKMR